MIDKHTCRLHVKRKDESDVAELYYNFQKAYNNVNHDFLEELLEVYGFPHGIQMLIIEMMARGGSVFLTGRRRRSVKSASQTASSRAMHSHPSCSA